jgi:NADH-ubiquinone oxidoreductase chain 4
MINLSFLITIPLIIMGGILFTANNYKLNYVPKDTNNLKNMTFIEDNHYMIPYVLRKYYMDVIDITVNFFPSLLSSSFWHNNTECEKIKITKERKEIITKFIKKIGVFLSLVVFSLLMIIWFKFNRISGNYQLLTNGDGGVKYATWYLNISMGVDGISLPFILLVGFIIPIVYWSNWSTIDYMEAYYILIIVLLELFLIIVFLVIDLVMFYVFFESILPPLFVLIGLYGASQKFRAGYYLFLYTLFGSLFMLLSFVKVGGDSGNTYFDATSNDYFNSGFQELVWLILFISFSVKTPLVPVHIWLPLAHSDANVSGSIILASIVLKLALYGFIRILINIFSAGTTNLTPFFYALCCLSVVYASCTTFRQFDLKVMVAYSSIAHMASSLLGTFSDTLSGITGSVIFGLAHGFVSPGLFILVGAVLYDRCGSRIINYFRGLNNLTPVFSIIFLLFIFANMGVPLTGNFIGEFLSLLGAYQQNIFITSIGTTSVILSAVYSIYFFNRITSGSLSPYIFTIPDIFRKEFYIILPLLVLTVILGIFPSIITHDIEFAISHCLLFAFTPIVFSDNNNEEDIQKLHEKNSNPHNTPIIENAVPTSSSRDIDSSSESVTSLERSSSTNLTNSEENKTNDSNLSNIGNPNSEEGYTSYVPLNDKKNKGVDSDDLNNRIENQFVKSESENNNSLHNENESNSYQNENESNNQENLSNSNLTRNNRDYDESDFEDESRFSLSSFDSYNSQNYAEIHNHSRNRW